MYTIEDIIVINNNYKAYLDGHIKNNTLDKALNFNDYLELYNKPFKLNQPILVRGASGTYPCRHFSHFQDGTIHAFNDGTTSFTVDASRTTSWKDFKLP